MNPINIGILGFAHGHVNMYCDQWRAHPELGVRVLAGWDRDPARAAESCKKHDIAVASSAAEQLACHDIHAVVIASETAFHADLVEQAAAAGKAVILQKPMALTLNEADRIVSAVTHANVPFTMAWQMRVDPHNLKVKAMLASGEFGKLFMVRRRHGLGTHVWKDFDKSWHNDPVLNRDIFADDAAHPIDFIRWLLGRPTSVTAELGTIWNPAVKNDTGIALFRYSDGVLAEVSCSFVTAVAENVTEIICERGTIVQNHGDGPSTGIWPTGGIQLKWLKVGDTQWTVSDLPDIKQHGDRLAGLAKPIAEFLHGKGPAIATAEEGRDSLRMVLACYESSEQGKRVNLWSKDAESKLVRAKTQRRKEERITISALGGLASLRE